ncbi:DUF6475 domain-containing protein [Planctomicrobium sp. SH668]|uniref:DUF6475 domain-containing protein n=1 Tax=Planctomicrobium sp. SH668 TaxID=3448126 RepID=UPI003F5B0357
MAERRTKEEIDRLKRIFEAFFEARNIRLSPDALRLWILPFTGLSISRVEIAISRFMSESTDYPTPAAVLKFGGVETFADSERAAIAWAKVRESMRLHGGYESVDFSDKLANAAIHDMGGWAQLCQSLTEDMHWREKEFTEWYELRARSGDGDGSYLRGIHSEPQAIHSIECGLPVHRVQQAMLDRLAQSASSSRHIEGIGGSEVLHVKN